MKLTLLAGISNLEIQAASSKHPNSMKFSGVLVRVDESSTKAPHGSDGHKIMIPRDVAAANLATLINMPLNYHDELDRHHPDKPCGVIKAASIVGNDVVVKGVIWKKSFPKAQRDLTKPQLGMSFEAANIGVDDPSADVWKISKLCFTGATILYKNKAAYFNTSALALAAAAVSDTPVLRIIQLNAQGAKMATIAKKSKKLKQLENLKKGNPKIGMPKTKKMSSSADESEVITVDMIASAMTTAMAPVIAALNTNTETVQTLLDSHEVSAAGKKKKKKVTEPVVDEDDEDDELDASGDDDGDGAEDELDASGDEDDEGEDELEAGASDDEDELEELGDEMDDVDDDDDMPTTPGKLNSKTMVQNKGSKTTVSKGGAGKPMSNEPNTSTSIKSAALVRRNRELAQELKAQAAQNKLLRKQVRQKDVALEAAAEATERRTIPTLSAAALTVSTLAKGNCDPREMQASGQKVTVAEIDLMAASAGLNSTQSMSVKNDLHRIGLLD